jgi:PAS domain S-box-containing protein
MNPFDRIPLRVSDENAALRVIVEGTATVTGERFFEALVENLARALNTHSAWVTEFLEETRQLRALAFWAHGELIRDFVMQIEGTPCEAVIESLDLVHYPDNILDFFPNNSSLENFGAVSYMGVPLLDNNGKILGHLAILDTRPMPLEPKLTAIFKIFAARASAELQRQRAESEVRKSEEKYRRIIETTGEGFLMVDRNFVITDVNQALCSMVGYHREEIVGKHPPDFATEDFRQFLLANQMQLTSGENAGLEGTLLSRDGRQIPILIYGNNLRDAQGTIIGNFNFVINMSEHKRALALAAEVQKSLLPQRGLEADDFDIAGKTISCEEIGGDYYDFMGKGHCAGDHVNVVVGDVTGHGVEAALLMTTARAFLRMRAAQCGNAAEIVTEMNRHLALDLSDTGRFMTLFYLRIDHQQRDLRWVRAGHPPAYLYDPGQRSFRELMGEGLALGVDDNFVYRENRTTGLKAGQVVAVGTDGIWEACNRQGRIYGRERFLEIIRQNAQADAQTILEAVYTDLFAFTLGVKSADDITLVVIKVKEEPAPAENWQI